MDRRRDFTLTKGKVVEEKEKVSSSYIDLNSGYGGSISYGVVKLEQSSLKFFHKVLDLFVTVLHVAQ